MKLTATIFFLIGSLLFMGCDEDVIAVLGTERPYSLYGVISPQLDSQWVRVFPIEGILEPAMAERLDAHFVSTDLQTGEEHVWRDSLILDALGQTAHVFWAPFRAELAHSYRLSVRSPVGDESSVEVTVPPPTDVVLGIPTVAPFVVRQPVMIQGAAPRLIRIEVVYTVGYRLAGDTPAGDDVSISYDGTQQKSAEGWVVSINLDNDFREVSETLIRRNRTPLDRVYGVVLISMKLRLIVANEEWNPPGGTFEVDVLVQPDQMTNVENGFGFVGAGYRLEETWIPTVEVIEAAGFRVQTE